MAHILVVDDEPYMRFLIRKILESAGHSIFEAPSGQDALDILETYPNPFDMVISDVRMSYMDGFEFLMILRRQPSRIPVLMVSAYGDIIPEPLAHELNGQLLKPFTRPKLIDAVNNVLVCL